MIKIKITCKPENTASLRDTCYRALVGTKAFIDNHIAIANGGR